MNILVAGMWRSGTSRLYNLCRIISLQNFKEQEIHSCNFHKFENNSNHKINIIKIHDYHDEWYNWASFVFGTKRNIFEISASVFECFDHWQRSKEIFSRNFEAGLKNQYHQWKNKFDLEIVFEDWELKKHFYIKEIAKLMNLKCDIDFTLNELEKLKNPNNRCHINLMFENHISPKTDLTIKERLSEEEIELVKFLCKKHKIVIDDLKI
jgi:hypothetical protein